jgi:hypothetical protein
LATSWWQKNAHVFKGVKAMARDTLINEEVNADRTDLRRTFKEIRDAIGKAQSREDLTELYKQTVYMILMTHSTPLDEKDREMKRRREAAEREFARTVRMINRQAKKLSVEPDYSEDWKQLSTNGYQEKGEDELEAQSNVGIVRK